MKGNTTFFRPQTRAEMAATLLRAMMQWPSAMGCEPTQGQLEWCRRTIDEYFLQIEHPIRKKYGSGLDGMSQQQIADAFREVAGTPWEHVQLHETPFQNIAHTFGGYNKVLFAPVEVTLHGDLADTITQVGLPAQKKHRRDRVAGVLDAFAWFVRGQTRKDITAAAGDLRKDVRAMRRRRCGRCHIFWVRFWTTLMTISPIVWDGCVRISNRVLRKMDGPRPG